MSAMGRRSREPEAQFKVGDLVARTDYNARGTVTKVGEYDDNIDSRRYQIAIAGDDLVNARQWWNDNRMTLEHRPANPEYTLSLLPEYDSGERYKIVRGFLRTNRKRVMKRGLTLAEAQAHCKLPSTSSRTATGAKAERYTATHGPWFDGYEVDKEGK